MTDINSTPAAFCKDCVPFDWDRWAESHRQAAESRVLAADRTDPDDEEAMLDAVLSDPQYGAALDLWDVHVRGGDAIDAARAEIARAEIKAREFVSTSPSLCHPKASLMLFEVWSAALRGRQVLVLDPKGEMTDQRALINSLARSSRRQNWIPSDADGVDR